MKKFDAEDLSLSNIIIILIPFALLFAGWFWISGKQYDFDGARSLAVDNNGVTYVQVDKSLYRFNAEGVELTTINLDNLGVDDFVGDLGFNAQNELLVRRGSYKTGFLENISIYFRVSNNRDIHGIEGEGLSFCNLNNMQCRPFGEASHDFNRGFSSVISKADGSVYISDASRHQVHKFDSAGNRLATLDDDLAFPNELIVDQSQLYFVDTNNKAIKQLPMKAASFGSNVDVHLVANADADQHYHRWPYSLEKVGNFWWVIILDSNMHHGGVYLYDENWSYVNSLELGDDAVPTAILHRNDEVLISDVESNTLARYSQDGEHLGDVVHSALNTQLASNAERRAFYKTLSFAYLFFIALSVIAVAVFAFRLSKKHGHEALERQIILEPALELNIDREGQTVEWLPTRSKLRLMENVRKIQLLGLFFCIVVLGLILFYTNSYTNPGASLESLSSIAPAFILAVGFLLFMADDARVRLGVYDNKLVLHDQLSDKAYTASGNAVFYDGRRIAFGELSVQTGTASQAVYDNAAFVKQVFPLLENAAVVKPHAMQAWRSRHEKKHITEIALKVVFVVFAAVVMACIISMSGFLALF